MFKTESLFSFALVAKHQSVTRAATIQEKTPMAISKQVSQLESLLAEPLFERSTRKVNLTQFGKEFLLHAQQILSQHDALTEWLESRQGQLSGTVKIIAQDQQVYDETIFPWLAEFHQNYPELKLSFEVKENIIDINHELYDIYWGVSEYLGIKHPSLKRRSLWKAQLGIFAAPNYLERYGTPVTPADLQNHLIIGHPHQQPSDALVINKKPYSKQQDIEFIQLKAPIKTVAGQAKLAVAGVGLINALIDNHDIKSYVTNQQLIPVLEPYWHSSTEIYVYYHQVKIEQPKIRTFIDFFLSKKKQW